MAESSDAQTMFAIYDAALDDRSWQPALHGLSAKIDALGAVLIANDSVGLPFSIEQSSFPLQHVQCYFDSLGHYDREVIQGRLLAHEPLKILRDVDVWKEQNLQDREDYRWLREKAGAERRALVRLSAKTGWCDLLAFLFDREWADINDVDARLGKFLPHIAKVVEVNRQFALLKQMYGATLSALDKMRIGTCILGRTGSIILTNREANRLISLGDGLSRSRSGRLFLQQQDENNTFERYVNDLIMTANGEGSAAEHWCLATRRSGAPPLILEIAPLRDSSGEIERRLAGCLVFVIDPSTLDTVSVERTAKVFDFTDAEKSVCHGLVCGKSLADIAEIRGVAEGTVKAQTRSIYGKCNVQNRVELIRLALSVEPPLIMKSSSSDDLK